MSIPHIAYIRLASPPQKKRIWMNPQMKPMGCAIEPLLSDGEINDVDCPRLQLAYHKL